MLRKHHDGKITLDEMKTGLQNMGHHYIANDAQIQAAVNKYIQKKVAEIQTGLEVANREELDEALTDSARKAAIPNPKHGPNDAPWHGADGGGAAVAVGLRKG